ncbi:MAG: oligosaccharide flippase family protein [Gallionella sp.]|nr:oligosaccharide flippase family protein [Gallionella sp.]
MTGEAPRPSLIDRNFRTNAIFSYATQALTTGLGFISVTLITRYGGLAVYGQLAILIAMTSFAQAAVGVRSNDAVVKFFTRGTISGDFDQVKTILIMSFFIDAILGAFLYTSLFLLSPLLSERLLHDATLVTSVKMYAAVALITFLRGTAYGLIIATSRFRTLNVLSVLEQTTRLLLLLWFVVTEATLSLSNVIVSTGLSAGVMTFVFYAVQTRQLLKTLKNSHFRATYVAEYVKFNLSAFASSTIKLGNQGLDTLALGALTGAPEVGVYNLFKQFMSPVNIVSNPLTTQIAPKFVAAIAEDRRSDVWFTISNTERVLRRAFFAIALVIAPAAAVYSLWNGISYTPGQYFAFAIMLAGAYIQLSLWWCRSFSVAYDIRSSLISNAVYTVSIIVLIVPLTIVGGLWGAAAAVTTTLMIVSLYWRGEIRKFKQGASRI